VFDITDRHVIVTGSNRGNGLKIATSLIDHGAKVIRIDKEFNTEIGADDYIVDFSDLAKLGNLVDEILATIPAIDALVNNAGVSLASEDPYKDMGTYEKTIDINLNATFILTSKICSFMKDTGTHGSIINITSLGATMAFSKNPSYQISKAGLKQLSKAFAMDWGMHGIRVNSIAPGYIVTKMTEKSFSNETTNLERKSRTMLDRWGKPEDLVGAIIFLISDASSYITASELKVDGGWSSYGV
jgi:NAD(P)-dependent dehydrogenase (short-subunit alcohol dehydrogenase family)